MPFAAAAREKVTTRVSSAQVNDGNLRTGTVGGTAVYSRSTESYPRVVANRRLGSPAPHCGIQLAVRSVRAMQDCSHVH